MKPAARKARQTPEKAPPRKTAAKEPTPDEENPEWTAADFARAKPAAEVFPQLVRGRGPQKAPRKVSTTLRVDPDVLEHFKKKGRGWQTRMNDALRRDAGL